MTFSSRNGSSKSYMEKLTAYEFIYLKESLVHVEKESRESEPERKTERDRQGYYELLITNITNHASCCGSAEASQLSPQTLPNSTLEKAQRVFRKTSRVISSDSGGFIFFLPPGGSDMKCRHSHFLWV